MKKIETILFALFFGFGAFTHIQHDVKPNQYWSNEILSSGHMKQAYFQWATRKEL